MAEPRFTVIQITDIAVWPADPADDPEIRHWEMHVTWRGKDRWVVTHGGHALSQDGEWLPETAPHWGEEWLRGVAFTGPSGYLDALKKAKEVVHTLSVMGKTYWDWHGEQGI